MIANLTKECHWLRTCDTCIQKGCQWVTLSSQCVAENVVRTRQLLLENCDDLETIDQSMMNDEGSSRYQHESSATAIIINDWFPLVCVLSFIVLLLGGLAAGILFCVYRTTNQPAESTTRRAPLRFSLLLTPKDDNNASPVTGP